jgi:hypothetical protein
MIDDGLGFSLVPWTPSLERLSAARWWGLRALAGSNGHSQNSAGWVLVEQSYLSSDTLSADRET